MFKILVTAICVAVGAGVVALKRSRKKSYEQILNESIHKSEQLNHDGVLTEILTLVIETNNKCSLYIYRRLASGKTVRIKMSESFDTEICPISIKEQLSSKSEIIVHQF